MREIGTVISSSNGTAMVQVPRTSSCEGCYGKECDCDEAIFVTATDPLNAPRGAKVEVNIQSGKMFSTVLVVFWLPLLFGLAGFFAVYFASLKLSGEPSEGLGILGAVIGAALSIPLILWTEKRTKKNRGFVITKILSMLLAFFLFQACGDSDSSSAVDGDKDLAPDGDVQETEQESNLEEESETETPLYRSNDGFIRDRQGRALLLRGVNLVHDYVKDMEDAEAGSTRTALGYIADSGLNAIRFVVDWNNIEPERDHYNEEFINRAVTAIRQATDEGLYVFLDMHQDLFGVGFGGGAPRYACDEAYYQSWQSVEPWFFNYFTTEVKACFDKLWSDEDLQARHTAAALKIVERIADQDLFIGFDPINEPAAGNTSYADFERVKLFNFYRSYSEALGKVAPGRLTFFEPCVATFNTKLDASFSGPLTDFEGVFAPHYYNASVEMKKQYDGKPEPDIKAAGAAAAIAERMGVPWMYGETGGTMETPNLDEFLFVLFGLLDQHMAGATLWLFKPGEEGFGLLNKSTGKWNGYAKAFLRPAPSAVAGTPKAFSWNYDTLTFSLTWKEDPKAGDTELLLPAWVRKVGYTLTVDGVETLPVYDSKDRRLLVSGGKGGTRTLTLVAKAAYPD